MSVSSVNMSALLSDQMARGGGGSEAGTLFILRDAQFSPLDLKGGMGFLGKPIQGGILAVFAGGGLVHRGASQKLTAAIQRMAEEFSKMNQEGHQILSQMASQARVEGGIVTGLPPDMAFKAQNNQLG